jgi:hypothetical protein
LQDPAASSITDFIESNAGKRVIVFDPNVRLSLIKDLAGLSPARPALAEVDRLAETQRRGRRDAGARRIAR